MITCHIFGPWYRHHVFLTIPLVNPTINSPMVISNAILVTFEDFIIIYLMLENCISSVEYTDRINYNLNQSTVYIYIYTGAPENVKYA